MQAVLLSRRSCLAFFASGSILGLLAACGGAATATTGTTTARVASSATSASSVVATSVAASSAVSTSTAAGTTSSRAASSSAAVAASSKPATKGITLEFWNPGSTTWAHKTLGDLIAAYNQQHPGVTFENVPTSASSHYQKYVTAMAGGTGPDAILTFDYTPVVEWAAKGVITPLDAYQARLGIREEDYFPVVWQMVHFHGHFWGFLQEFDFGLLGWNKRLFHEVGLNPDAPPKTMDELDAMAGRLTKKDVNGALQQVGLCPWITGDVLGWTASWGGSYYDPSSDRWTIVQDQNVKTLDWFGKYGRSLGGVAPVQQFTKQVAKPLTPFYAEKMAMAVVYEWEPGTDWIPKLAPALQYGMAFPPTAPGVPYGTGQADGGNVFVLPKSTHHPTEAANFLSYMAGPGPVFQWNAKPGGYNVPPVKSVAFDPKFAKATPGLQPWIDLLKQDRIVPVPSSPLTSSFLDQLDAAQTEVVSGKRTAQDALAELDHKMQGQVQQFHATNPNW